MSKSASDVLAELRKIVVVSRDDAWKLAMAAKSNDCEYLACNERGRSQAYHRVVLLIDELSASDEQSQPGLLPCPFCGSEATESTDPKYGTFQVCCLSPSCDIAPETRTVPIADADDARERWNTRANKTQ